MNNPEHCHCEECEPEQTFVCTECLRTMPYCMGQDDDYFDLCNDCVARLYPDD